MKCARKLGVTQQTYYRWNVCLRSAFRADGLRWSRRGRSRAASRQGRRPRRRIRAADRPREEARAARRPGRRRYLDILAAQVESRRGLVGAVATPARRGHTLAVAIVEGYIPHDELTHGREGRERQLAGFVDLVRDVARLGVEILCYNFMPDDDWTRTTATAPERGGALVTAFDAADLDPSPGRSGPITAARLWDNLAWFLDRSRWRCSAAGAGPTRWRRRWPGSPPTRRAISRARRSCSTAAGRGCTCRRRSPKRSSKTPRAGEPIPARPKARPKPARKRRG